MLPPKPHPPKRGRERRRTGSQLDQRFVTHYLTVGDGDGSCAKDSPEYGRRPGGCRQPRGAEVAPQGVGKGRGARNRTLGRDVGSYRYPITLTCFLLQLKSGRTSAPRLPGPSQPRTWVFPPAHYCESSLSYASTPACGLRCQLDVTEALLFLAANSARKGRR